MDLARIEGDELVIRLPLDALVTATEACPALYGDEQPPKVTDRAVWAREVVCELNREAEDGTTLVHIMFDTAFEQAADQGAEGILFPGNDD